ncbi:hypothetical protein C5B85_16835 [Pseudoclavibacter sp. AY1F1]|uniref:hypothetical protein n=1 Tax=Pseudoclavibacter sp. AY1F1 TaxID=2080583 RepID=UPI000CE9096E|nr:hypothetical protein [Pseudoclavibacter sp. AY1F1]PPF42215.1 hypothetical protein C5B85_16835 [Pseudoclavibacter sp. AY1F1]
MPEEAAAATDTDTVAGTAAGTDTAADTAATDTESIRIERTVAVAREELWLWLTESAKTAQWIGPWHYVDESAGQIGLQLVAEEGAPASGATIRRCEAPGLLEVLTEDSAGSWHLRISLESAVAGTEPGTEAGTGTTRDSTLLVFEHFDVPKAMLTDIRAGWNFYLDLMLAAKDGLEKPRFEDYLESPMPEA